MLKITFCKCETCKEEFALVNEYGNYCIKCGSNSITITKTNNTTYSLYNHKTGYIE